jgi:hypothetical protein
MDAPIDLPSELQEVEVELQAASKRGDWKACKALIAKLAAEAELGRVVKDETELAILQIEDDVDVFPEIQTAADARINKLSKMKIEGLIAVARHSYAVMRFHQIKDAAQ